MFDPTLPVSNANATSAVLRSQFQGLKDLIDALQSINAAQVDGVTTGNPGDPASANVAVVGSTLGFTFGLPRGQEGLPGQNGQDGSVGPQGPPFAQAMVDAVNTVNPGDPAAVGGSFDGTNVHFTFSIPRGNDGMSGSNGSDGLQGTPGTNGSDGPQGPQGNTGSDGSTGPQGSDGAQGPQGNDGPQGVPGEVSLTQLNSAISGTSANSNGVATLGMAVSDPPTQSEMQSIANKLDELINALRR